LWSVLIAFTALSLSTVTALAQQPSEEEIAAYMAVIQAREPEEIIKLFEEFLEKYPQSIIIPTLLSRVIPRAAEIDPGSPRVLDYAKLLVEAEGATPMAYNNAAWALFEATAHLDTAAVWAGIAIKGFAADDTSRSGKRNRALVLDTVANIAYARGEVERGIRLETEAAELDPARPDYKVTLGGFLVGAGRQDEAEPFIVDALLRNPRDAKGLQLFDELASSKAKSGMSAEEYKESAIQRGIDRMLAETQDETRARRSLAVSLAELGLQADRAMELAREAVRDAPENPIYKAVLGELLLKAEEWDEAEEYLVGALLRSPRDRRARSAFDQLVEHKESTGISPDTYKESAVGKGIELMLAEAEDEIEAKRLLASALEEMGLYLERAQEFANEAVRGTGPERGAEAFLAARVTLAKIELEMGNYEEVLAALEPATRLATPYEFDFHLIKGKALEELGRSEEAIDAYLQSAGFLAYPPVMTQLEALWEKTYGEEKNLEDVQKKMQEDLESWYPAGEFEVPAIWSGRVVMAELFTGSECAPCVASDLAYDYLLEYYPEKVLAVLVYHLHIPGPDPMTNPDAEARQEYYNARERVIGGTPTSIVNGTDAAVGGGRKSAAKSRFDSYSWSIENGMANAPAVEISLSGERTGNTVKMSASVSIVDRSLRENENLRLLVVLAEKVVHHEGSNGVSEHKMVVRKLIGGTDGFAIDTSKEIVEFSGEVDISELEASLLEYLTDWEIEHSGLFREGSGFSAKRHEIDESQLMLVAFVQDDTDRSVLQAMVLDLEKRQ
jgi:tetratricopeptide (TPR) repeat protein